MSTGDLVFDNKVNFRELISAEVGQIHQGADGLNISQYFEGHDSVDSMVEEVLGVSFNEVVPLSLVPQGEEEPLKIEDPNTALNKLKTLSEVLQQIRAYEDCAQISVRVPADKAREIAGKFGINNFGESRNIDWGTYKGSFSMDDIEPTQINWKQVLSAFEEADAVANAIKADTEEAPDIDALASDVISSLHKFTQIKEPDDLINFGPIQGVASLAEVVRRAIAKKAASRLNIERIIQESPIDGEPAQALIRTYKAYLAAIHPDINTSFIDEW